MQKKRYSRAIVNTFNERRILLKARVEQFRVDLANHFAGPYPPELLKSAENLELSVRQSLQESIKTMQTICRRINLLNMATTAEAIVANYHLREVCYAAMNLLNKLEKSDAPLSSKLR